MLPAMGAHVERLSWDEGVGGMHVDAPGNCKAPFPPPMELTFAHAHSPILTPLSLRVELVKTSQPLGGRGQTEDDPH